MADEIHHNHDSGATLYFCVFQQDGDVFLSNGESDEVWGTGGRGADNYDMAMAENAPDGHFVGTFDASITIGSYHITVYLQAGGSPADSDRAIGQGEIYWNGTSEETIHTIVITNQTVTNVYDESTPPPITVIDESLRL